VLEAGLAVSEDDSANARDFHAALLGRTGEQRKINWLALDHFGLRRLEFAHDSVPLALGKDEGVAGQVQVNGAVEIPVWKRVILVGTEIAGAADWREDALAVVATDKLPQNRRRKVGALGLLCSTSLLP